MRRIFIVQHIIIQLNNQCEKIVNNFCLKKKIKRSIIFFLATYIFSFYMEEILMNNSDSGILFS